MMVEDNGRLLDPRVRRFDEGCPWFEYEAERVLRRVDWRLVVGDVLEGLAAGVVLVLFLGGLAAVAWVFA